MTCENAKSAVLSRVLGWAILTARKLGLLLPAKYTSLKLNANGCNGCTPTADPSCQRNTVTPKTKALISARADKATIKSLRSLYLRQHMSLAKGG